MGSVQAGASDKIQRAKNDMKKTRGNSNSISVHGPETFSDMCKLLGIKGMEESRKGTLEDTPTTKPEDNFPLLKKKSHQLISLGLNAPKVDQLLRNAQFITNAKPPNKIPHKSNTNVSMELPYILQSVKPWSSGVSMNSSKVIHVRKLKPLEVILKKNCKPVPKIDDVVSRSEIPEATARRKILNCTLNKDERGRRNVDVHKRKIAKCSLRLY
eukprot:TRINITY_DN401_c0_g1_i17.p1 TRINITY_DN401_c0_g1~~TRINITY_DN401_c0_g1_i17.p1  ORF type:complete len:213 (-),score=41.23 TRINITY_DN401_c0_g1_i17:68-706(-)